MYCVDNGEIPHFGPRVQEGVHISNVIFNYECVRSLEVLAHQNFCHSRWFPSSSFKKAQWCLTESLAPIFEVSFRTGVLPAQWLTADVCPVFKKQNPSKKSNYRPNSLTCISCKVMESIIKSNLLQYLRSHNLITSQ